MDTSTLETPGTTGGPPATGSDCGCPGFRLGRRRLLGAAAAAAGVMTGAQLFGESFRQVAFGAASGGNVVVVLSMRGGADGLSIVVPSSAADQAVLAKARPDIYVPAASLVAGDQRFGLHPGFAPLADMWSTTKSFAAVHSVGLPAPNRSHFDAMVEIEDADPGGALRTGWINRTVGLDAAVTPEAAMQVGSVLLPTSMQGPAPALGVRQDADLQIAALGVSAAARAKSLRTMWAGDTHKPGKAVRNAVATTAELAPLATSAAAKDSSVHTAAYPSGPLQAVLANTAALIRADVGTRMVTVDYGNWDMHQGLGRPDSGWMNDQVSHLAGSLKAFFDDLGGAASRVTVVTMSEFGRRVAQNGSGGVDHGYGNAMLLLGAGVNGGQVHGPWSGMAALKDGDVPMQTNFQSVLWEVLTSRFPEVSGSRATVFPGVDQQVLGTMI